MLCRLYEACTENYEAACGNGREMDILWEQTREFACNNELRFQRGNRYGDYDSKRCDTERRFSAGLTNRQFIR